MRQRPAFQAQNASATSITTGIGVAHAPRRERGGQVDEPDPETVVDAELHLARAREQEEQRVIDRQHDRLHARDPVDVEHEASRSRASPRTSRRSPRSRARARRSCRTRTADRCGRARSRSAGRRASARRDSARRLPVAGSRDPRAGGCATSPLCGRACRDARSRTRS